MRKYIREVPFKPADYKYTQKAFKDFFFHKKKSFEQIIYIEESLNIINMLEDFFPIMPLTILLFT